MKRTLLSIVSFTLLPTVLSAQVIVDDSWADGGRNNGADPQDTDWWYSTASNAIEVGSGFLGMVTGTSGRGVHGTFASQALLVGDTLTATFTFTTPATVANNISGSSAGFRIGLYDTTGKPGLAADLSASSGSPNATYNNLNGYMMDLDVNLLAGNNITFRQRTNSISGQLQATTADFEIIGSGGGDNYGLAANTSYTGVLSLTRTGSDELELTASLFQGLSLLSTHSVTDSTASTTTFGMLAFHAGSNLFGSSATPGQPDNGIDFTNIKIEYVPVPEPGSLALAGLGAALLAFRRRR
ncbi:MAG TPA: PEP-CTERM sorting domain-containing protein [Verrucomicrobiota bacterium]|nr:PEP-CTERM sorting domain-containing protein [Verrucomicrobiota bacterium]